MGVDADGIELPSLGWGMPAVAMLFAWDGVGAAAGGI